MADTSSPPTPPPAAPASDSITKSSDRWEEDVALMNKGITALFHNDLEMAETLFVEGIDKPAANTPIEHDVRGSFALLYAIVALLRGIGSLADDQISECASRLERANALAQLDHDWAGKAVICLVCSLATGVVQCVQFSFVQGAWNIIRSWAWVKPLRTEALEFKGRERVVVRSAAMFALGMFNLMLSLLPRSLVQTASYISGFEGSRSTGLDFLFSCYEEGGVMAPFAALVWVIYHVDSKSFLGETQTKEDLVECEKILDWAEREYKESVFFNILRGDLLACNRDPIGALETMDKIEPHCSQLRALRWVVCYKRSLYHMAQMHWSSAANDLASSIDVYAEVGRRSMVPFTAMHAALCYLAALKEIKKEGQSEEKTELEFQLHAMLDKVAEYRAMDKKNWGRQDKWAFRTLDHLRPLLDAASPKCDSIALLELAESMSFANRSTKWMDASASAALMDMLMALTVDTTATTGIGPDETVRALSCVAQIILQQRNASMGDEAVGGDDAGNNNAKNERVLELCAQAVKLESQLSASGVKQGSIPMIRLLRAFALFERGDVALSRTELTCVRTYGKSYYAYPYVMFKMTVLGQAVGQQFEEAYQNVNVGAGTTYVITLGFPSPDDVKLGATQGDPDGNTDLAAAAASDMVVEWDWVVHSADVSFTAKIVNVNDNGEPLSGAAQKEEIVQTVEKQTVEGGAVVGKYVYKMGTGEGGKTRKALMLCWDNTYSYFRPKKVTYRVTLDGKPWEC